MSETEIWNHFFESLHDDVSDQDGFEHRKPLLAHYTSLAALESVLRENEIWLSNPLFMNDFEEVRFGIIEGSQVLRSHRTLLMALGSRVRQEIFVSAFDSAVRYFEENHLFDTYVFCFSEHRPSDNDGLLSMWRGYGGNGRGVAIVFDTAKLKALESTPLILAKVQYAANDERRAWLNSLADKFAPVLSKANLADDNIYLAANALLERIKNFSLFSKHHGFEEEQEWRLAYRSERDTEKRLESMLHYVNGPRGVEPKLRLKIEPLEGVTDENLSLDHLLDRILLGPSTSSPLAKRSVQRMLQIIGRPQLKDRVIASTIPFRTPN